MSTTAVKTSVQDPRIEYDQMLVLWQKAKAVCTGEHAVKAYDDAIDVVGNANILIPFSNEMDFEQYSLLKAEGEFPGIVAEYLKIVIGTLLRKEPVISLDIDSKIKEDAENWLRNEIGQDDSTLVAFLTELLEEEVATSRSWIYVDHPVIPKEKRKKLTAQDAKSYAPYPIMYKANEVINWYYSVDKISGKKKLTKFVTRTVKDVFLKEDDPHPVKKVVVNLHEIVGGVYQIRVYEGDYSPGVTNLDKIAVALKDTLTSFYYLGDRMDFIPAYPTNGRMEPVVPLLMPLIDKEIALYNKVTRRNHLMYGACTYTPVVFSSMSDDDFSKIVNAGLGTWLKLPEDAKTDILKTPSDALADMEVVIQNSVTEIGKLGVRMLSPEKDRSGVAEELRGSSQTVRLSTLNVLVSATLRDVFAMMLSWRYNKEVLTRDVSVTLAESVTSQALNVEWMRLVTEWYENQLIPRSLWLRISKGNDIIPPDYDDKEGTLEMNGSDIKIPKDKPTPSNEDFLSSLQNN